MITVDARRAGGGKTTGGIYPRIKNILARGGRVMIVVPSIALQEEYVKALPEINFTVINNKTVTDDSTVAQLVQAYRDTNTSAILITHKTFTMNAATGYNNTYDLIIDEALEDIIRLVDINESTTKWRPDMRMYELYEFATGTEYATWCEHPTESRWWYKMNRIAQPGATTFSDSETFRQITDPNYDLWVTANSWSVLTGDTRGRTKVITTLSPHILHGWNSVHIAAAAFDNTMMALWMKNNKIQYTITHQFERNTGNIHLHAPQLPRVRSAVADSAKTYQLQISKSMLLSDPQIREQYHQYVEANKTEKPIAVRNNCFPDYTGLEQRIQHNVYGVNQYRDALNVNIETAIIPDTQLTNFLKHRWLSHINNNHDLDNKIVDLYRGYRFYQIIMRGNLRVRDRDNSVPFHIYMLDETASLAILNYIDITEYHEIPIKLTTKSITRNPGGRPVKYKTEDERKQAKREAAKERMRRKRAKKSDT